MNFNFFSVPQPPHNKVDEYGNRVGGFEGEEDPFIFDVRPIFNNNNNNNINDNSVKGGGSNNNNNNYFNRQPQRKRKLLLFCIKRKYLEK